MNTPIRGFVARHTLLILIVAIAAGIGLWSAQRIWLGAASPPLKITLLLPEPRPIPEFHLQGGDGQPFTAASLRGRWHLLFLGYTRCPDVCPTTLADLGAAEKIWSSKLAPADRPRIVFVSVDPQRDSPAHALDYAHFFSKDAYAATGELAALEAFARSLGMVFMQAPAAAGQQTDNYGIDHSAQIVLIDPQGRFAGLIRPPHAAADIASDMLEIIGRGR